MPEISQPSSIEVKPQAIGTWAALKNAISLALELAKGVKAFLTWLRTEKAQKWINDAGVAFRTLNEADTPEKKKDAASKIGDLLRRL